QVILAGLEAFEGDRVPQEDVLGRLRTLRRVIQQLLLLAQDRLLASPMDLPILGEMRLIGALDEGRLIAEGAIVDQELLVAGQGGLRQGLIVPVAFDRTADDGLRPPKALLSR